MSQVYCNNCGKHGHIFNNCKVPITSFGIVAFRNHPENGVEYLMVRRKDTLGYMDFMRGKYSIYNKYYIHNMIKQMTNKEKDGLLKRDFGYLWKELWGDSSQECEQYINEENISKDKFETLRNGVLLNGEKYSLASMIEECDAAEQWEEAEWGFPKGRRNYQEKDYDCAVREFCEETGYMKSDIIPIHNIFPFEESFLGSNYKSYKHKYYLTYMKYDISQKPHKIQASEISCGKWHTYELCMSKIRHYNLEKQQLLAKIHNTLTQLELYV